MKGNWGKRMSRRKLSGRKEERIRGLGYSSSMRWRCHDLFAERVGKQHRVNVFYPWTNRSRAVTIHR